MHPNPKRPSEVLPPLAKNQLQKTIGEMLSRHEDGRPILIFLAGPNGSGKSSFFDILDEETGRRIPFVNADIITQVLHDIPAADELSQKFADLLRVHLVTHKAAFATETVFSDPVGAKVQFLRDAMAAGFHVVMVYVALASWQLSKMRVEFRAISGMGHNVEPAKLQRRYQASQGNATEAAKFVEDAIFLDNSSSDLEKALTLKAICLRGSVVYRAPEVPPYIELMLPHKSPPTAAAPPATPPKIVGKK